MEDYKCGMTTIVGEGWKKVLKISGKKCTQMLAVIIACWQNYGQLLFFFIVFSFSKFSIINSYYL